MTVAATKSEQLQVRSCAGLLRHASGLLPLALLIGTGLWGLDSGLHWDECRGRSAQSSRWCAQASCRLNTIFILHSDYWLKSSSSCARCCDLGNLRRKSGPVPLRTWTPWDTAAFARCLSGNNVASARLGLLAGVAASRLVARSIVRCFARGMLLGGCVSPTLGGHRWHADVLRDAYGTFSA